MQEQVPGRIWSHRRQWLGNLVPLGLAVVVGLVLFPFGVLAQSIGAIIAAWWGVSKWGFFENSRIEQELRHRTGADGELIGFVSSRPPTALDAHAEIGLLTVHKDSLVVVTEDDSTHLKRDDITSISRQFNIHSLLGLGGWIVLNLRNGQTFKLESRKYPTMLRSRIRSKGLAEELTAWKHEKAPA